MLRYEHPRPNFILNIPKFQQLRSICTVTQVAYHAQPQLSALPISLDQIHKLEENISSSSIMMIRRRRDEAE
jgi:hypothetical protein